MTEPLTSLVKQLNVATAKNKQLGSFVAFQLYLGRMVWPLIALGWVTNLFQRGMASMQRLHEVWSVAPEVLTTAGERVEGPVREGVEARPTILWLKDYNGDGKAFEFALFEAEACMGLQTTLIGYSEKQDRVI